MFEHPLYVPSGGDGEGGGGEEKNEGELEAPVRTPQSKQSVPRGQMLKLLPEPPSSQSPSDARTVFEDSPQVFEQVVVWSLRPTEPWTETVAGANQV